MPTLNNITSADATAVLIIETAFPSGIILEQFSTDQSITQDELTYAETRMGVDGYMAAGYVPRIYPVTIMFEASSPSLSSMNIVAGLMDQQKTLYACSLIVTVLSVGQVFTWSNGTIKSGKPLPDLKKVLDPVTWKFDFEKLTIVGV